MTKKLSMNQTRRRLVAAGLASRPLASTAGFLSAATVSSTAVAQGAELTYSGAIRAANADGSIPAYSGGLMKPPAGYSPQTGYVDPFPNEKPLFTITGANADQYRDQVSEGLVALLKKNADFRMPVYTTHRTAGLPEKVIAEVTAETGKVQLSGGNLVNHSRTPIPFPTPKTAEQAMYYFLSGYTSKLAGTERGLGDKPQATFSTCFGAPFLPLKPTVYAELLSKKLTEHGTQVWLLNTGWSGGAFGTGHRIALPLTRAMISAVLSGTLDQASTHTHPIFGVEIPNEVPGVPREILNPELSWSDQSAYHEEAASLAKQFARNFEKYRDSVSIAVAEAGPRIN